MNIACGGLDNLRVQTLLTHHVDTARTETAPGSAHALDLKDLRSVDVTFWSAWDGAHLLGVGALKRLSSTHGEIKSMHTSKHDDGQGSGRRCCATSSMLPELPG